MAKLTTIEFFRFRGLSYPYGHPNQGLPLDPAEAYYTIPGGAIVTAEKCKLWGRNNNITVFLSEGK